MAKMLCTELTLAKLAVLREIPSCLKNRLNLSFFNMVILRTKLLTMFVIVESVRASHAEDDITLVWENTRH